MKILVTCDTNWESKVDYAMSPLDLAPYFSERNYGEDLEGLGIVLMCRDPHLAFKPRVRYSKERAHLSMDVMLSLNQFVASSHPERRRLIANALISEVPKTIRKRRFRNFDLETFESELASIVSSQLLGPSASLSDATVLERATGF